MAEVRTLLLPKTCLKPTRRIGDTQSSSLSRSVVASLQYLKYCGATSDFKNENRLLDMVTQDPGIHYSDSTPDMRQKELYEGIGEWTEELLHCSR